MIVSGGNIFSLLIFMAAGVFVGTVISLLYIFVKLTKYNFIVVFFVDFLCAVLGCFIFYVTCIRYFYASVNFYFIVCFVIGIVFDLIFIKNLIANPVKYVYNKIIRTKKFKKDV